MKKFPVLLLLLSFAIVGCKSNEEKAADLIKKELSKSLFDFESYSPIETTVGLVSNLSKHFQPIDC